VASAAVGRNVLGDDVLTDTGTRLGAVTDLIVELNDGSVIGYQLQGDEQLQGRAGQELMVPLPVTLAVSGDVLLVPESVQPFIRDDLSGFGSAVDDFRQQLETS
jgi:sporulation protein YlmC with PRC-barrel domain